MVKKDTSKKEKSRKKKLKANQTRKKKENFSAGGWGAGAGDSFGNCRGRRGGAEGLKTEREKIWQNEGKLISNTREKSLKKKKKGGGGKGEGKKDRDSQWERKT